MHLDHIPIWAIFLATILVVAVAMELGFRLGHCRRRAAEEEKESSVSAIAGAVLGLAAFMQAFTFSIVTDRHATRRALVRDEAVAIRTALQRSEFLPESDRGEAAKLLKGYVNERVSDALHPDLSAEHVKDALARTRAVQDRLWQMAVINARKDMNSDVAALYIESLNDMNGLHAQRLAVGLQSRIPGEIWTALYCITVLGVAAVGYHAGIAGSRRSMAWSSLSLAFALVLALNASLDRPDSGIWKVSQQPLIDLQDFMKD